MPPKKKTPAGKKPAGKKPAGKKSVSKKPVGKKKTPARRQTAKEKADDAKHKQEREKLLEVSNYFKTVIKYNDKEELETTVKKFFENTFEDGKIYYDQWLNHYNGDLVKFHDDKLDLSNKRKLMAELKKSKIIQYNYI